MPQTRDTDKDKIRQVYDRLAREDDACCPGENSPGSAGFQPSYENVEGHVPEADLGLGCGIPLAEGELDPGDTVLDLGSGAGNDCFVARRAVGVEGKVIGVDFSEEMLRKARRNAADLGYNNVEFRFGEIENLPVSDDTIDVVISNCVLNLVPDKARAFGEIRRVLKPDGYFSVSDVVLRHPLPDDLLDSVELQAGCVSGALQKERYLSIIREVGFDSIDVTEERDLEVGEEVIETFTPEDVSPEDVGWDPADVRAASITVRATRSA